MAVVAGIKIKVKAPREKRIAFADEKYTGTEPEWNTEEALAMEDATFDHHLRRSFYYYNYHYSQKDCKKHVVAWAQKPENGFTKDDLKAYIRSSDRSTSMTACSLVMAHKQGMPLKPRHIEFLKQAIQEAIESAEPEVVETAEGDKPKAYVPTIQDRLAERTSEIIGELEGIFDDIATGVKNPTKLYEFLVANNVVQSQLGKYEGLFRKRKEELELAQSKKDDQVREGYSHLKAADFKRIIGWIDDLLSSVEQYRGVKKATKKARVKKAPSKEKLVAKLKYAKTDAVLKIVSINPADIIGASELWVYNAKTRKLGKYVAASYKTLSIKGTSIEGFDTDKSTSKTLRKPEEKLKEFAKAGKIQLRKFLDDIKATETKLNGRINTDVLLLRVA
jgi:hypothetical protein